MTEPVAVPTALLQRSNQDGLRQLAAHVLLLGVTGTTIFWTRGTLWLVPAILLQGIVLVCVFCPLHETTHRTAFASRNLNRTVGWLCGALLLLPPEFFRQFHFAHHRYAQDAARDPELAQPAPASFGVYLWRASGLPNWQRRLSVTLRHALTGRVTEPFVPAHQHAAIVAEARILWLVYLAVLLASVALRRADALIYWILPVMVAQPFLRLFLLAEHFGCAMSEDTSVNTRTTLTNPVMRLLTWQMSYHAEHHAYPAVPFHALAKVNALMPPHVTARGYLALHRELILRLVRGGTPAALRRRSPSRSFR
jgi:fatty acid desaturase